MLFTGMHITTIVVTCCVHTWHAHNSPCKWCCFVFAWLLAPVFPSCSDLVSDSSAAALTMTPTCIPISEDQTKALLGSDGRIQLASDSQGTHEHPISCCQEAI